MTSETIKVLLIEDDEDDYILTRELFSLVRIGRYALDWASSYEEGMKIAGRREHHVCLVDYRLGERSGVQLIREARESRLTTPMILLTGQGNHDVDVAAMQAGATDYLIKDETSPERLERTIRYAVQLNTERKEAEAVLMQSESKFRALFENALDAVLIANDQGTFVDANPAARALLGIPHNEIMGRTLHDFTEEESKPEAWPMWEHFLKEGGQRGVIRLQRPDGQIVDVDFSATANFLPGRHFSVLRDVTERRKLEEQLRQSQKLESVGMLAGGIAHDFNNLLTVIAGYSALTLMRLDRDDPLARNVEEIKEAAARATSLTRQLLAFSRKQVLQPKVLDLNSVIVNTEKMLGRLVGEDMELHTLPGVGLGQCKADPGQIEQVILNLAVNARDAMPKGGKITIETANVYLDEAYARRHVAVQPGWYVMLAVSDTGHGMDAATQKSIFEPFFTTKEQGKGTGLGLSTVYGIVKQSGGNIWVYSEVGVGTTFKIYLPLVDERLTEPDAIAACPESAAGTETILLTEDEEMVRKLAREILKTHGYTVLEAANAGEALAICNKHEGPIHLLLTDVVMPRMSGKELAEQVVVLRPDTRVLYMSGYTDHAIVHHGILDGDIAFVGKPFTPDALVLKVVEVLHENVVQPVA